MMMSCFDFKREVFTSLDDEDDGDDDHDDDHDHDHDVDDEEDVDVMMMTCLDFKCARSSLHRCIGSQMTASAISSPHMIQ